MGLDPFRVEGGKLVISAGPTPPDLAERLWGYPYVSGMLSTFGHLAQTYGYFAIRARVPAGPGLWTAFWLMPVEPVWPPEIDLLEVLGHQPDRLFMNLHTGRAADRVDITELATADLSADFFEIGVAWRPDRISWYLDGTRVLEQPTPGDLHQPMHLLVTLAVGGHWPGPPDASTVFPAELVLDHVRIYQFDDLTARPTASGPPDD